MKHNHDRGAGNSKLRHIIIELGEHLPYSIFGVTVAMIIMGLLSFMAISLNSEDILPRAAAGLFHVFHPIHILLSALVTTAMFWKHEKRVIKTLLVGFFGSILICGLSDIYFPYLGGRILGAPMEMHMCILEHPHVIIPFAITGALVGFVVPGVIEKSTEFSHSVHILVSSVASILYIISFGIARWTDAIGGIFLVTVAAVVLPCCLSDIVFPLTFVDAGNHRGHREIK